MLKQLLFLFISISFVLFSCNKEEGDIIDLSANPEYYHILNGDTLVKVYAPDTFTPDGDGMNEVFYPIVVGDIILSSYELKIFSNLNEEIFISEDVNSGWDGRVGGVSYDNGTYPVTLKFILLNGTVLKFKCQATLIR
jgi:hypothetical protein